MEERIYERDEILVWSERPMNKTVNKQFADQSSAAGRSVGSMKYLLRAFLRKGSNLGNNSLFYC